MESRGVTLGEDAFLVFSPEREDPGNTDFTIRTIPKVCDGFSSACFEVGVAFYSNIVDTVVPVSSTRVADHDKFDYPMIEEHARLIVDCRGRYLGPNNYIINGLTMSHYLPSINE